jgi:hypothetical protein
VTLWGFPAVWYTRSDYSLRPVWLSERTNVVGWSSSSISVSEAAERLLVADRLVSREFRRDADGQAVRVFSAKRYSAKPHDIGLFVHTPDRCWTQGGWQLQPAMPDSVDLEVQGVRMVFERRIFMTDGQRELVYFGGLVGGQPLPYRLDHNLSVGTKYAFDQAAKEIRAMGAGYRSTDKLFWQRVWEAFVSRRRILGPKQFIRISTPVGGADVEAGDRLLQGFLESWLYPVDYQSELDAWFTVRPS